jgi:RNA polymerase sigma factor (sigma-70 family)
MPPRLCRILSAAAPSGDVLPDAELLRQYVATRDASAFELLVRRHADVVWAVCARVLGNEADADDAFQATFLVLARKAATVRGACAAGWLYRVAVTVAMKHRACTRREPAALANELLERSAHADHPPEPERNELAAVVHEELTRLPERYRLPVVLCDLEGHTHTEAARLLNWPIGSVSGRLSRAHAILRDRLTRRGFAAPIVLTACAAPARSVLAATGVRAVAASPVVTHLAQGVLFAMRAARLKLAAVLAAGFLSLAGFGTVLAIGGANTTHTAATQRPLSDDPPEPEPDPKTTIDPKWVDLETATAYADIPAITSQSLKAFERKHVEPVYVADPPLRKLLKAKLWAKMKALESNVEDVELLVERKSVTPHATPHFERLARRTAEVQAAALELNPKDRRPWLVLQVAAEKRADLLYAAAQSRRPLGEVPRLEAEIALARHDAKK